MWKSKYGHPKVHLMSQLPKPVFNEVISCADGEYIKCICPTYTVTFNGKFVFEFFTGLHRALGNCSFSHDCVLRNLDLALRKWI